MVATIELKYSYVTRLFRLLVPWSRQYGERANQLSQKQPNNLLQKQIRLNRKIPTIALLLTQIQILSLQTDLCTIQTKSTLLLRKINMRFDSQLRSFSNWKLFIFWSFSTTLWWIIMLWIFTWAVLCGKFIIWLIVTKVNIFLLLPVQ